METIHSGAIVQSSNTASALTNSILFTSTKTSKRLADIERKKARPLINLQTPLLSTVDDETCWGALRIDQAVSLKIDQGRKPREWPPAVDNYTAFA
jgi:hypothetical protein